MGRGDEGDGADDRAPAWALCLAPKPPTEDNSVAVGCLGVEVTAIGEGTSVAGTVPADGCLRFGPDTTMPGFRPRDPDSTGGYYQPVRAELPGEDADLVGFGFTRIKCRLPTAPTGVSQEHFTRYVPNVNPMLLPLEIDGEARTRVAARSRVTITASWPRDAAEVFLHYDPSTQRLIERREAMRVAWFTTAGSMDVDASAVLEDEPESAASTTWTTPDAGTAWVWLVLRDSRGGIATRAVELLVE